MSSDDELDVHADEEEVQGSDQDLPQTPDAHVVVKKRAHRDKDKGGAGSSTPAASVPESAFQDYDFKGNEEMHKLWDENQSLRAVLGNKEQEVAKLQDAVVTLTEELEQNESGQDPASLAKDLAKKNRALRLSLERERTRRAKQEDELRKVQAKLDIFVQNAKTGKAIAITPDQVAREQQLKEQAEKDGNEDWKAQYTKLRTRFSEIRSTVTTLRQELVVTQKALQKEVGDDVPLENILSTTGKWRGRAQEISMLKTQIMQLKRQAGQADAGVSASPAVPGGKEAALFDYRSAEIQVKQHEQTIAKLQDDMGAARTEIDRLKKKCGNLNSRKVVVENSLHSLNDKLKILVGKSDSDDALISALRDKLKRERDRIARSGIPASVSEAQMAAVNKSPAQVRLEREVRTLKEEVLRARQVQLEAFYAAAVEWDRNAMEEEHRILTADVMQQQELANMYKTKYYESESKLVESVRRVASLEAKLKPSKKQASVSGGGVRRGRGRNAKASGAADTATKMEVDTVESLRAEKRAMSQHYENLLSQKEEEVSTLKSTVARLREVHREAIEGLRQQFGDIQERLQLAVQPSSLSSHPQKPRGHYSHRSSPARRQHNAQAPRAAKPNPRAVHRNTQAAAVGVRNESTGSPPGSTSGSSTAPVYTNRDGAQIMRMESGGFSPRERLAAAAPNTRESTASSTPAPPRLADSPVQSRGGSVQTPTQEVDTAESGRYTPSAQPTAAARAPHSSSRSSLPASGSKRSIAQEPKQEPDSAPLSPVDDDDDLYDRDASHADRDGGVWGDMSHPSYSIQDSAEQMSDTDHTDNAIISDDTSAQLPRRASQQRIAASESRHSIKPSESRHSIKPSESRHSVKPSESRHSIKPSESRHSIKPSESRHSIKPSESRHTIKPSESRHSVKPSESRHSIKPSESRHSIKPSESRHSVKPSESRHSIAASESRHSIGGAAPNTVADA